MMGLATMKLLIIGGTLFLGRGVVDAALARGHEVTLFNRGKTNADLYPELEQLHGDRDGGLDILKGRTWDAVVDPSGYIPRIVRASAELLADAVEHYTFISSISVYSAFSPNMDESGPVGKLEDETVEQVTGESYGPLKVLCEQAAEAAMPGRVLNVRAGLIVGPHDPTDRFTYWVARVAKGGEVLAPDSPDFLVQYIDVRDLGEWIVRIAEARTAGIYNATGQPVRLGTLLETCQRVSQSGATFTYIDGQFLLEHEVGPWNELPMWLPPDMAALNMTNVSKAVADGLTFRPIEDTVRATLEWNATRPAQHPGKMGIDVPKAGLDPEKETRVLQAWKARARV
jgi:2'-hydroxyisoflavone reductase